MITVGKKKSSLPSVLATVAVFAVIVVFAVVMLNNASAVSSEEAINAIRKNVTNAVICCYAYEGVYPDDLEYLEENYYLIIDKARYLVFYEKTADNLMPNIIVRERERDLNE